MQTEYTGPIEFEQSKREHDQITVEERHTRLRNMVSPTNWLMRCSFQLIPQSYYGHYQFIVLTEHLKVNLFQGETCIMGLPNIIMINDNEHCETHSKPFDQM